MIRSMDFQDSNRDGIDDRDQDQFGRGTRFFGQIIQDTRARLPSNFRDRTFQPERSIQDRLGGIADMIRARDAKGARTPPRFPGGQPPAKNYREQIIGRMPRPEFGRDTIPFVPPYMQNESFGPVRPPQDLKTTGYQGRLPPPSPYERNFIIDSDMGMNNFRNRQRLPPPNVPIVDFNDPRLPFPGRVLPQIPVFPQPPGRFPQPFPQPGRKGQRNIPQPGGYYPQPPSSPMYPGRFPSPGRKGNRGSYQQPQMPFGYGQMRDMSSRFGGYGMPQNIYGFQNPDYQPYQPPVFEAPPPGGPTPQPMPEPGPAPYPEPTPMPGPMPGPGGPGKGRGTGGGPSAPMGPMPSPGGKGRGGPSPGQFPFVERYDGAPEYTTPFVENPALRQPYNEPDFGAAAAAGLAVGAPIGGGMGGGAKMKMGGQTAYPNQNVLSSYMMG